MSKVFEHIRSGISNPGLASDPSDPQNGDLYYNTASNVFRQYLNGAWSNVGTSTSSGTVTSVSVVSANGLAGTVATSTTTPALTLSTTINSPILAGNGTAISAATTTGTGSTAVLSVAPAITSTWTLTDAGSIINSSTSSKVLAFSLGGMSASTTLTLASSQTTSHTLTIPNITASDTLATLGLAQTFTALPTIQVDGPTLILQNATGGATPTELDIRFNNSSGSGKGKVGFLTASNDFTIQNSTTGNLILNTNGGTTALTINNAQIATFNNGIVAPGYSGNTTGSNFGSPYIGQVISSNSSSNTSVSSYSATQIGSLSLALTAGIWEIVASFDYTVSSVSTGSGSAPYAAAAQFQIFDNTAAAILVQQQMGETGSVDGDVLVRNRNSVTLAYLLSASGSKTIILKANLIGISPGAYSAANNGSISINGAALTNGITFYAKRVQ